MKKKHLSILPVFIIPIFLAVPIIGCKEKKDSFSMKFDKNTSYALGMAYGSEVRSNIERSGFTPDYDSLMQGFKESMMGKKTRYDMDEVIHILEEAFTKMSEERNSHLMEEENTFLAENAKKPGITITSTGLQYEVIKEGTGKKPEASDTVLVHYTGTLADGTVFDSSRERGEPAELPLDRVIPGWAEGLQLMRAGSNYILYIPSEIGYGPEGMINPMTGEPIIPYYATLIFDVELIDIK